MKTIFVLTTSIASILVGGISFVLEGGEVDATAKNTARKWTEKFDLNNCNFTTVGSNTYFILQPGYQAVFEGTDEDIDTKLTTTILNQTKVVDGIDTRIIEGRVVNAKTANPFEVS